MLQLFGLLKVLFHRVGLLVVRFKLSRRLVYLTVAITTFIIAAVFVFRI